MPRRMFDAISSWWKTQIPDYDVFVFLDPGELVDDDLELVIARKAQGDTTGRYAPSYGFDMIRRGARLRIGNITLRIGHSENILNYAGHIGYTVFPEFRGNRYAARGCELLFPFALLHGINPVWITCNPDNWASRRTCEIVGGKLIEIVEIPRGHEFYANGEREKCRYRVDL